MLPKKNLIPLRKKFRLMRAEGRAVNGTFFGAIVRQVNKSGVPRLAFVVTKKVSKSSVIRNQVKRKLAAAVSPYLTSMNEGIEIVFLAKSSLGTTTQEKINEDVKNFLEPYLK